MGLSTPGIGSGLQIKEMVDAYVKAEIVPLQTRHDTRLKSVNTELSAIGQLKSSLSSLQTSIRKMSDLGEFYSMKYSLSNPDYFNAVLTPQAVKGTYQIEVQQLAQQHSLASTYLNPQSVGSGTMTINFGTYNSDKTTFTANGAATPVTITIPPGGDSLIAVRDAINNSGSGVSASIVQDSQGSRLTITSSQTGASYAMQISGDISALNYDPTTNVNSLTEGIAATDSIVKLNGLILTQSTNKLENAIAGTTLNLKKAQLGTTITMTIDDNKDQVTSLVNDFIKKYNESMTLLTNLTGWDPNTEQGGLYQGDPQFRSLKLNLNKWATGLVPDNNGPIQSLADLGIKTNKQGLLEMKTDKFNTALANNYADIGAFFAKTATPTDSNIRVNGINSKIAAGSYKVVLDQYTPGVSMSGTIGGLPASSGDGVILNGSGNLTSLSVKVLSGSTGSRGEIVVKDGLAVRMDQFLDTYLTKAGDLDLRATQLNKEVTKLGKVQDEINTRSLSLEQRYTKQFNALDLLLAQMQNTSKSLSQQLDSLPKFNKS